MNYSNQLKELADTLNRSSILEDKIESCALVIVETLKANGVLFTCGNGGSAADALHLAEELVGKFSVKRRALPAICVNSDPTALTCIANDFGFDQIFSRQISALGKSGDLLVCFSTSGNSENVLNALKQAAAIGMKSILMTGNKSGAACELASYVIDVPSGQTARIQEIHTFVFHYWLSVVDQHNWE